MSFRKSHSQKWTSNALMKPKHWQPHAFQSKNDCMFQTKNYTCQKLKQQTYTSLQLHLPRTVVFAFSPVPQFAKLGLHALSHLPKHLLHLPKHLSKTASAHLPRHPQTLCPSVLQLSSVVLQLCCKLPRLGHSQPAPSPALLGLLPEDMFSHEKWEPLASSKTERMWAPQSRWKVAAAPCDWRPRFVEGV